MPVNLIRAWSLEVFLMVASALGAGAINFSGLHQWHTFTNLQWLQFADDTSFTYSGNIFGKVALCMNDQLDHLLYVGGLLRILY